MPFGDAAKNLMASKTFWSGALGIVTGVATIIAGREVDIPSSVGLTADQITTLGVTIGPALYALGGTAIASGLGAIYGRIVAHRPIAVPGKPTNPPRGLAVMNDPECIPVGGPPKSNVSPFSGHFSVGIALIIAASFAAIPARATTWYVSTTGSDANLGKTAAAPFRHWQKAASVVMPGDTVKIKPGVYKVSASREYGALFRRSGTASAPILVEGDGGVPTLDCSGVVYSSGVYCLHIEASNVTFRALAVAYAKEATSQSFTIGVYVDGTGVAIDHIVLDRIVAHDNQGPGVRTEGAVSNSTVVNSDSHDNSDPATNYGNADGFEWAVTGTGDVGTGNRAWNNTDDGYDLYAEEYPNNGRPVTLRGNWSFRNGFLPGTTKPAGDGVGYKLGWTSAVGNVIERNLSWSNGYVGMDSNEDACCEPGSLAIRNNTTFSNGQQAFAMDPDSKISLDDNIAVSDRTDWLIGLPVEQSGNSWQIGGAMPSDFQSTDPAGTDGARQADGSLPSLPFLRPVAGGRLAGIGAYAP